MRSRRNTAQREAVLREFAKIAEFVSAQALHARLVADGVRIGLTTVYRMLRDLEEDGAADVVRDEAGERLYRRRVGRGHRHYLICRCCGRSRPVDSAVVEEWADRIASDTGYAAVEHTVELTGVCGHCRRCPSIIEDPNAGPACRPELAHRGRRRGRTY